MLNRSAAPQRPLPDPRTAWAKSVDGTPCLSLTDHSVDVAAMAEAILSLATVRERLGRLADRRLSETDIARVSFFAGLHDFGKAVHSFQRRLRDGSRASHIAPAWALLGSDATSSAIRTEVRSALKRGLWKSWFADCDAEAALWDVVLAHHGSLPTERPAVNASDWRLRNGYAPLTAVSEVVAALEEMFPSAFIGNGDPLPAAPRFLHALAGLVVLADWLGSDQDEFRRLGERDAVFGPHGQRSLFGERAEPGRVDLLPEEGVLRRVRGRHFRHYGERRAGAKGGKFPLNALLVAFPAAHATR